MGKVKKTKARRKAAAADHAPAAPSGRRKVDQHQPPVAPSSPREEAPPAIAIPIFPPPDGKGRPHKPITKDTIERMCRVLRVAGTVEQAALAAGISPRHFFNWQRETKEKGEAEGLHFLQAIEAAKQARAISLELQARAHAKKDPKTTMWLLERYPETRERFKPPKVTVLVEEELTNAIDAIEAEFEDQPEILDRVLSAIARAYRPDAAGGEEEEPGGGDDPASGEAVHTARAEP